MKGALAAEVTMDYMTRSLFLGGVAALLVAASAVAYAQEASSSGDGPDQASACQNAKTNAPLAIRSQLQLQGISGKSRVAGFGDCSCSLRSDYAENPAVKQIAYICTVNVRYDVIEDE